MKYYLATIDMEPAGWDGENQLVYAEQRLKSWSAKLYTNLKKLKRDIEKSKRFRIKNGFQTEEDMNNKYSWVKVESDDVILGADE